MKYIVNLLYLLITSDLFITLTNWHLEQNPVVLTIGKLGFSILHFLPMIAIWYLLKIPEIKNHIVSKICLIGLFILYLIVLIGNLTVVL